MSTQFHEFIFHFLGQINGKWRMCSKSELKLNITYFQLFFHHNHPFVFQVLTFLIHDFVQFGFEFTSVVRLVIVCKNHQEKFEKLSKNFFMHFGYFFLRRYPKWVGIAAHAKISIISGSIQFSAIIIRDHDKAFELSLKLKLSVSLLSLPYFRRGSFSIFSRKFKDNQVFLTLVIHQ